MQESMAQLSGVKVEFDEDGLGLLTSTGLKNLGLNIQQITQYASQLMSVTNSLGQTGETSLAIADSFTKLAGDISSLFNVDYDTVAKNLQSGLLGQSRALYKYGIDITNATLQTYAYELGLEKTVSEMTQMEKQQLRVMAILDQSKVSWGDLANTINSPSNMIRQLTNNLKEAGMVLGQLFVPAVEKILPVINGFSIAIKQLLVDFAGIMGIKINFDAFGQGYSELEDEVGELGDELDDTTESANRLKNALRGFDKLNVISSGKTGLSDSLNASFDLTEQIKDATEEYNKMWNEAFKNMESRSQYFAKKISEIFGGISLTLNLSEIGKEIEEFANGIDFGKITENFTKTLDLVNTIVGDLADSFTSVFSNVSPNLIEAINNVSGAFGALLDVIKPVWDFLDLHILPIFEKISSLFINMEFEDFNMKVKIFTADLEGLVGFVNGAFAGDWDSAWEALKVNFETKFQNMIQAGKNKFEELKDFLGITDLLEEMKKHFAQDKVELAFEGIGKAFESIWKNALNGVIDLFNSFIDYLNEKITFSWEGNMFIKGGTIKLFEIPRIPKFETGGFPEDGWFRASKGEYFGSFDDGTSVIANNGQIIGGIANGVREANAEQNQLLREQNALLRQILAKDTGISSRDVFNAVRTEDRNYSLRNGQSAFAY